MARKKPSLALITLSALYIGVGTLRLAAQSAGPVEVSPAVQSDVSPPLRSIRAAQSPGAEQHREKPLRPIPQNQLVTNEPDGAVQTTAGPSAGTTNGLNIAGVGNGDYGFAPNAA